jgi:hypothetical protein
MREDMELGGLRTLVTGGTKGRGDAVVARLREAGANVLATARVSPRAADTSSHDCATAIPRMCPSAASAAPPIVPMMRPASSLATRTVIVCIRCRTVSRVRTVSSYAAGVYCARYGSKGGAETVENSPGVVEGRPLDGEMCRARFRHKAFQHDGRPPRYHIFVRSRVLI